MSSLENVLWPSSNDELGIGDVICLFQFLKVSISIQALALLDIHST